VVLYGSIGLPEAKFTKRTDSGAICVRQSAYRTNDELFRYALGERDTILIAGDHPIVCEGLIAVFALEDDLKVVGHAHDGEEACVLYKQLCPDILHPGPADAKTHNCGCPALPQRAILILHRALHNPPSVWNRSVEHCLGRHVMPSKTNPCLGASHDRKLASFRKNAPINPTIHFRRSEASIAISFSVKTFCTKVSTTIITGYQHFDLVETRRFLTSSYESNRNTRLAD
jgi:hypothetical protein